MLSPFLYDLEWLTLGDFTGQIARCRFSPTHYRDEFFQTSGIVFPASLTPAVTKRRAEYLAGRYLAQQVLARYGRGDFTLLTGNSREPLWPQDIAGALSHNANTALCAVQQETGFGGVGLDVETLMSEKRAADLWTAMVSEAEYQWLHQQEQPFNQLLTLVFSAKESLFKALFPQVQRYFDFLDAQLVALDSHSQTFELELLTSLTSQCPAGRRFTGHYLYGSDDVTTIIYF